MNGCDSRSKTGRFEFCSWSQERYIIPLGYQPAVAGFSFSGARLCNSTRLLAWLAGLGQFGFFSSLTIPYDIIPIRSLHKGAERVGAGEHACGVGTAPARFQSPETSEGITRMMRFAWLTTSYENYRWQLDPSYSHSLKIHCPQFFIRSDAVPVTNRPGSSIIVPGRWSFFNH